MRRLLTAAGALLAAVGATVALAGPSGTTVDTTATLAQARAQLAVCQVARDTAVTAAEQIRAADCIADLGRVITKLATPTPTPTPVPTLSPSPGPVPLRWPTEATTGVPLGWVPKTTRSGDWRITTAGVYEDVRVTGSILVDAANVTLRRVEVRGGHIDNIPGSTCRNGMVLEQVTVRRGTTTRDSDPPAIGDGGYTARSVAILGNPEGFRDGGRSLGCGPVTIENSYARVVSPDVCSDWHGDGIQGYDGPALTVKNVAIDFEEVRCGGTAPFFVPYAQGNTTVNVDGLLVSGGGFAFRLGVPGLVKGLRIVADSWGYGPIDVRCSAITGWEAGIATASTLEQADAVVKPQLCQTEGGG